jgi:uncharacterized protein (DUF302 family)
LKQVSALVPQEGFEMGLMDAMMDMMIKSISKEKREQMMINMMPMMMEGIDFNEFMPKMMTDMLKDVTVDDLIAFIKRGIEEQDKLKELADKIAQANLMQQMMFKVYQSKLDFDETVSAVAEAAPRNGWEIPDIRDLQKEYQKAGLSDATKVKIIYFCNPQGGYDILKDDRNKSMSVMMPMGVSIYETSDGQVEIAAMNLGMMSGMFSGVVQEVLNNGAANLEKTLQGIVG